MGGREGLVDTAVKTAETGYLQRRMMKVSILSRKVWENDFLKVESNMLLGIYNLGELGYYGKRDV